jgi:hypothetical protein
MMLSGVEWRECKTCPKRFLVLVESERTECLECGRKRKRAERRANESRAWHAEKQGEAVRKNGRPRKYRNGEERRAAKTQQQRDYRLRPSVEKTPSQIGGSKGLAGAKNASLDYPLTRTLSAWKMAPSENGGARV